MGGLVSTVSGALGLGGGNKGVNYQAGDQSLWQPVNQEQIDNLYGQTQNALTGQINFTNALAAQHGIQNQSDVYNQLQQIASGKGPNPAQAMLANATGANVANQAALMAGQRGAGANVGLMARQAAQQGAATQQNAIGQGAALQAQQSLGAINAAGNLANTQVAQQQAATNAWNQYALQGQQNLLNSIAAQNAALNNKYATKTGAESGIANTVAQGQQQFVGNLMGGIGVAPAVGAGGAGKAHGGMIEKYADGGMAENSYMPSGDDWLQNMQNKTGIPSPDDWAIKMGANQAQSDQINQGGPQSSIGRFHMSGGMGGAGKATGQGLASLAKLAMIALAKGGDVPALVSPGEKYIPPSKVEKAARGNPMKEGITIPGKAKVQGDSYANDTVPATLEEGGIVLPRSVTQHPDAPKKSAEFVAAIMRKKGKLPSKKD